MTNDARRWTARAATVVVGFTTALGAPARVAAQAPDATPDGRSPRELAASYVPLAHEAAVRGDCELAKDLAGRVRELEPAVHAQEVMADPWIVACLQGTPPPPPPAGAAAAVPAPVPVGGPMRTGKPPLSGLRIGGEVGLGLVTGAAGGVLGLLAGAFHGETDSGSDFVVYTAYAGVMIGMPIGVYLAGSIGDQGGSLGWAYAGALLGFGAAWLTYPINDEYVPLLVGLPAQLAGSVIAFNLSRRWDRRAPTGTALLSVQDGELALGIPLVTRGTAVTGEAVTSVPLLGGTW